MIQMAESAGFKGEDAAHIAAIAMAEGAGKPDATGPAGEVGLTQINPNAWGFAASARDPQQAFNDAFQVYQKQGWGAWSTDPTSKNFTPGNSMARFLPQAEADLGKAGGAACCRTQEWTRRTFSFRKRSARGCSGGVSRVLSSKSKAQISRSRSMMLVCGATTAPRPPQRAPREAGRKPRDANRDGRACRTARPPTLSPASG